MLVLSLKIDLKAPSFSFSSLTAAVLLQGIHTGAEREVR